MTFVDDNGNQITFNGEFAITKRSVSLFDGKVSGDTSINFSIDNNSYNRKILGYHGPQMANQIAATKQPFNRTRNGNIIDRGYIVIQDEYNDVLDCYYVSGNSNWVQELNFPINQLDYTGVTGLRNYITQMNDAAVDASVGKTFGIVFPIVDWWANYERGLMVNQAASFANSIWYGSFNGQTYSDAGNDPYGSPILDFYPCFFFSSVMDEIIAQTGIKISGTLFQDQLFKSLVFTPSNGLISKTNLFNPVVLNGTSQVFAGAGKYNSFIEISDNDHLFSSGTFTANKTCNLKSTVVVVAATGAVNFTIYKNNVSVSSYLLTPYTIITYIPVMKNDQVEIRVTGATTTTINWTIEEYDKVAYNSYFDPSNFLPNIKCVDFIKFLINYFGCSSSFDDFSNTLTLNIIEKYKKEDAQDWSQYYLSHRSEYTVNTAMHNYLNWKPNTFDKTITDYNALNTLQYGSGDIQTDSNLVESKTVCTFPFIASSFGLQKNKSYIARVPIASLQDDGDPIPFTSISYDATSGLSSFGITTATFGSEWVRVVSVAGTDYGLFFVAGSGVGVYKIYFPFYANDTGTWIKQRVKYNNIGAGMLSIKTMNTWDLFPGYSNFYSFEGGLKSSHDYGVFTKFRTGLGSIDQWKANLAVDNPNISGFTDTTIREQYMDKIENIFNYPPIRAMMILPEAIYQSYKFDRFVFIRSKKLTAYFFVENIANYIDSNTPVEVNLLIINPYGRELRAINRDPSFDFWQWYSGDFVLWNSGAEMEL